MKKTFLSYLPTSPPDMLVTLTCSAGLHAVLENWRIVRVLWETNGDPFNNLTYPLPCSGTHQRRHGVGWVTHFTHPCPDGDSCTCIFSSLRSSNLLLQYCDWSYYVAMGVQFLFVCWRVEGDGTHRHSAIQNRWSSRSYRETSIVSESSFCSSGACMAFDVARSISCATPGGGDSTAVGAGSLRGLFLVVVIAMVVGWVVLTHSWDGLLWVKMGGDGLRNLSAANKMPPFSPFTYPSV